MNFYLARLIFCFARLNFYLAARILLGSSNPTWRNQFRWESKPACFLVRGAPKRSRG